MKTRELVDLLNKCDPEGDVLIEHPSTDYGVLLAFEISCVLESKNNGNAFIRGCDEMDKNKEGK